MRVAFRSTQNSTGALVVNVFHVEAAVFTDPPDYAQIADDMGTWLGGLYTTALHTNYTLADITVTEETYPGAMVGQGISVRGSAGGRSGSANDLDVGLCQILQLKTATPKRYARGRLFMPPALDSTQCTPPGRWATASTMHIANTAFGAALLSGHSTTDVDYAPIIFSRTQVLKNLTPFQFPVTAVVATNVQHMLRSRQTSP